MSSTIMKLYAPRMLWKIPDRPNVRVCGFHPKKNSLLFGRRLSPSTYCVHVVHSSRRRYIPGGTCCDGYCRSARANSCAWSVELMFEKLFEPGKPTAAASALSAWLDV